MADDKREKGEDSEMMLVVKKLKERDHQREREG